MKRKIEKKDAYISVLIVTSCSLLTCVSGTLMYPDIIHKITLAIVVVAYVGLIACYYKEKRKSNNQ